LKNSSSRCFGLVRRREQWSLTWRGWLALLCLLVLTGVVGVRSVHDFLAVAAPVDTTVLVIEGWVPRYSVTSYVARVSKDYAKIYTVGGATKTDRSSRDDSDTYAHVLRTRLMRAGVPPEKVQYVPCWNNRRDRTYGTAVAFREWCVTNQVPMTAFNVVTVGPHARRSRLLFEKAFPDAKVGIIPLTNEEYDADHWWRYSEGVKETLSESMAYLYSRFLFSPE
jgi:uncharacterized SAM-binding protein YcdF (DUF218 family)